MMYRDTDFKTALRELEERFFISEVFRCWAKNDYFRLLLCSRKIVFNLFFDFTSHSIFPKAGKLIRQEI